MALKITAIFLLSLLTIVTASPLDKRAVSCDAGNFLAPATSYSPGGCTPCYAFTFAATKGANKCIACPTLPSGFSACSSTTGKPTTWSVFLSPLLSSYSVEPFLSSFFSQFWRILFDLKWYSLYRLHRCNLFSAR